MTPTNDRAPRSVAGPWWYHPKRWLYRHGRPGRIAAAMNAVTTWLYRRNVLTFGHGTILEVRGRTSGKAITLPVVVADHEGSQYLVSMLGPEANWVRNVRAAGGRAAIRQRERREVLLVDVPVAQRAAVIRRYLELAPGARPHIPIAPSAPLEEFEHIAARYPVYRIVTSPSPTGP